MSTFKDIKDARDVLQRSRERLEKVEKNSRAKENDAIFGIANYSTVIVPTYIRKTIETLLTDHYKSEILEHTNALRDAAHSLEVDGDSEL